MHVRTLFAALAISLALFTAPALATPEVAGQWWWEGNVGGTQMILNQNGHQLKGRIQLVNGNGWDVEGALNEGGDIVMDRWIPVSELSNTRRSIVEQLLAIYGDPAHPEMLRGKVNLKYDPVALKLTGTYTRIAHRSSGDTLISHNEVVETAFLTRGNMLPDLIVNFFAITPYEGKDVNGNPIPQWHVQAEIKNVGFVASTERFRIELKRKNIFGPNPNPAEYTIADSATHIQRLEPAQTQMIEWHTDRQTDWTSPPNITANDVEITVEADTEKQVLEGFENNNRKTLVRLDCQDPEAKEVNPLVTVWVEKSTTPANLRALYDTLVSKVADPKQAVLCYIRLEAQRRAKLDGATVAGSNLLNQLETHFMKDYLAAQNLDTALKAIGLIGEAQGYPGVGLGAYMYVPEGLRAIHTPDPDVSARWEWLYPATQFWRKPFMGSNVDRIPQLDVPFLVGRFNAQPGDEDDAIYGGKNLSNVMHWATGLKYQALPSDAFRELFIGYEYWHMEGFDVFGEDSLNDLIGEEAGRLIGKQIATFQIRSKLDLLQVTDRSFREARAWVGTMVRYRLKDLDAAILSDSAPQTHFWMKSRVTLQPWSADTIGARLNNGQSVDEIIKSGFVSQLADIYALKYYADEWDRQNGPIQLTEITKKTLDGAYNSQFLAAPKAFGSKWDWKP